MAVGAKRERGVDGKAVGACDRDPEGWRLEKLSKARDAGMLAGVVSEAAAHSEAGRPEQSRQSVDLWHGENALSL